MHIVIACLQHSLSADLHSSATQDTQIINECRSHQHVVVDGLTLLVLHTYICALIILCHFPQVSAKHTRCEGIHLLSP